MYLNDLGKVSILALFFTLCIYSSYIKVNELAFGGKTLGIRQLEADYQYCDKYPDHKLSSPKSRNDCKRVIGDAIKIAQEKCYVYLDNEKICRLYASMNGNPCNIEKGNVEGCSNLVVSGALQNSEF